MTRDTRASSCKFIKYFLKKTFFSFQMAHSRYSSDFPPAYVLRQRFHARNSSFFCQSSLSPVKLVAQKDPPKQKSKTNNPASHFLKTTTHQIAIHTQKIWQSKSSLHGHKTSQQATLAFAFLISPAVSPMAMALPPSYTLTIRSY